MKSLLERARHIVVEGPIGTGKGALAQRLAAHLGASLQSELAEANPFLERFYQDRRRYALQAQLFFLFQRADRLRELAQPDFFGNVVVSDFLLDRDELFARINLDEQEYKLYRQIYAALAPQAAPPDLVIYLHAGAETLITRVRKRGQEIERKIGDAYLARLGEAYSHFFHHYDDAPLMIVNADHLDFAEREEDFRLLVERLAAMRGRREYFSRGE